MVVCCSAIWEFPLGRNRSQGVQSVGLLMLFKMGVQASAVCLCCSCWCVKWNSGSWVGLRPSLYLPPSDYFTPLIFLPLHWSEKITGKRERGKERGREGRGTIDWPSTEIQRLTAEPWVAMLPLSPLIYDWDPWYIQDVLFYKSLQIEAKSSSIQTCWDIQKRNWALLVKIHRCHIEYAVRNILTMSNTQPY